MASLIKNQILKHLSVFTKNLSPDQINVSTLKGEGELTNLMLDEGILTELLDLPSWLKLTRATCNRVAIKIQWTKLKSQPICLYLDEITVAMETCEEPRHSSGSSPMTSYNTGGKYGFAERIIDGMFVSINSVVVNFRAKTFAASIQISRILVQSKMPTWEHGDLRLTRIKDENLGQIIIFKEAEWQTLRIEANALEGLNPTLTTTPLRLIANQSKIRITIKKRLIDCGIIASRLEVNLDDLLWVLTDSQLKAALVFANSLRDVVKKSSQQSQQLAAEKLKKQGHIASPTHHNKPPPQQAQRTGSRNQQAIAVLFSRYDVKETSYHLYTGRIDLHLCDDSTPDEEGQRRKVDGGAMQVTIHKMALDFYPYHPAGSPRSHWLNYDDDMKARNTWAEKLLEAFKQKVRLVREIFTSPQNSPSHVPKQTEPSSDTTPLLASDRDTVGSHAHNGPTDHAKPVRAPNPPTRHTKLLESCLVFRLEDYILYKVSTASDPKRCTPKKFISSEKKKHLLPPEMSSIHIEYTDYYFPDGVDYPVNIRPSDVASATNLADDGFLPVGKRHVLRLYTFKMPITPDMPHANMYVVINPMRVCVDYLSLLWLNALLINLLKQVEIPEDDAPKFHVDIKLDALMPRIVIPAEEGVSGQSDRPDSLKLHASRLTLTNCRLEEQASVNQLLTTVEEFDKNRLFVSKTDVHFPNDKEDLIAVPDNFRKHAQQCDSPYLDKTVERALFAGEVPNDINRLVSSEASLTQANSPSVTYFNMRSDSFKRDANKDLWCLFLDQVWVDFDGVPSSKNRPVPLLEAFPLTLWLSRPRLADKGIQSLNACNTKNSQTTTGSHDTDHTTSGVHKTSIKSKHLKAFYSPDGENAEREQTMISDNLSSQTNRTPSEDDTSTKSNQLADLYILVKVNTKVNLQLNHYQYLFLMRLLESISKCQQEIETDTAFISKGEVPAKNMVISAIVKDIELALVCPPLKEIPSLQSRDTDLLDSKDDLYTEDPARVHSSDLHHGMIAKDGGDYDIGMLDRDDDSSSPIHPSDPSDSDNSPSVELPQESLHGSMTPAQAIPQASHNTYLDDSSTTTTSREGTSPEILISEDGVVAMNLHVGDSLRYGSPPELNHHEVPSSGVSSTTRDSGKKSTEIKKSFNTAITNFSKGFGSSYSKITEKMKQNVGKMDRLDIGDDSSMMSDEMDTISVKSEASSDEDYLMRKFTNANEVPAFERKRSLSDDTSTADLVSDVMDDESEACTSTYSSSSSHVRGMVSVFCLRLGPAATTIQMKGKDLVLAAQVDHVTPIEHGNINLDKFQSRFARSADRVPAHERPVVPYPTLITILADVRQAEEYPPVDDPPVKLRFQVGPEAEKLATTAGDLGFLHCQIENFSTKLLMSSLTNLTDLIEDEIIPPVMPMKIEAINCAITLKDDKPPTYMTSPGTQPFDLYVSKAVISRHADGVFRVTGDTVPGVLPIKSMKMFDKSLQTSNLDIQSASGLSEDETDGEARQYTKQNGHSQTQSTDLRREKEQTLEQQQFSDIQRENDQLRRQLEKIGKLNSATGSINTEAYVSAEAEFCKEKAHTLERENSELMEQFVKQQDEILTLKQERESLLATIQLLQEELFLSEQNRTKAS